MMLIRLIPLAALLASTALIAAPVQKPTSTPALTLDHVGIQVADLGRSVEFYTKVLGLHEVPAPFPKEAARWLSLGNGRLLHIVAHGTSGAYHNRWDHFALACSDMDAMIARLDNLHIAWADMDGHRAPQLRPDHVQQIFVRDPDGYNIEINDAKIPTRSAIDNWSLGVRENQVQIAAPRKAIAVAGRRPMRSEIPATVNSPMNPPQPIPDMTPPKARQYARDHSIRPLPGSPHKRRCARTRRTTVTPRTICGPG